MGASDKKGRSLVNLLLGAWLHLALAETTQMTSASISSESSANTTSSIEEAQLTEIPTDYRATYPSGDITLTVQYSSNATVALSSFNHTSTSSSSAAIETLLHGSSTDSGSASTPTAGSATCNGHAEFCNRKYSNITYVVAHNSPFHKAHNAASNQDFDVTIQLNDGIRGIYLCHTSCDELNAGTLEAYLTTVKQWLDENRYEVITIILGNEDFIDPGNYTAPFTNAGMLDYLYIPPTQPMDLEGWPTLADMIISDKRVVAMLAYDANQQKIPWLLDIWSYQWQTPFSPTDPSFPCTVQRPPGQARGVSQKRLYLANHNLNVAIALSYGSSGDILVPDVVQLNSTNANDTVYGSAQLAVEHCTEDWGRPPNFLLIDYYNRGNFNGSTLAVAAKANNVSYDINSCCGSSSVDSSGARTAPGSLVVVSLAVVILILVAAGL
ncbi:hypothetical protein MBLNU13_g07952t2 [Cladosporium sp. NU13]